MDGCFSESVSLQPLKTSSDFSFTQSDNWLNDRYQLLKLLGQGSFGKTYLAVDRQSASLSFCVIKQFFYCDRNSNYHKALELFRQEAFRLAELGEHPQIPRLLDSFEQDEQLFIVQEWIDGLSLEEELVESEFNENEIQQLLEELLPVLQYIHDRKIVHRDIKPANIIRRRKNRQLVLVDFGAAKYLNSANNAGTIIGSAEYAAPEQIRGLADFSSDLYSLGVTCLHLLTQMSPFELYDIGEDAWKWQEYLIQPLSPEISKIIGKLLQPATRRRYQSAAEVLADLQTVSLQRNKFLTNAENGRISNIIETENPDGSLTNKPFTVGKNLQLAIDSVTAIRSVNSATIYAPQPQGWYQLSRQSESSDFAWKVALFLSPRLAESTTPIPTNSSQNISHKNGFLQSVKSCLLSLFKDETKESFSLVFFLMSMFVLTCIGTVGTIDFVFEMEKRSRTVAPAIWPTPQTEIQGLKPLPSSRTGTKPEKERF